jgi:hypothetical protein
MKKNIYVIPTKKPSRLKQEFYSMASYSLSRLPLTWRFAQHIYITNSEEIKEGINQWYLDKFLNKPRNSSGSQYGEKQDVIILTTDQDLIKDGVQAIDDEFLEWFVKNPSCEDVDVEANYDYLYVYDGNTIASPQIVGSPYTSYKIIVPQEEPKQDFCDNCNNNICCCTTRKQETLEEVAKRLYPIILEDDGWDKNKQYRDEWIEGAKWKEEQYNKKYSEEEVFQLTLDALNLGTTVRQSQLRGYSEKSGKEVHNDWFNQNKKK